MPLGRMSIKALAGAGAVALASVALVAPGTATAAKENIMSATPCAEMGRNVNMLGVPTPTCTELYTYGDTSIALPQDGPRIVYGTVNMTSASVAPKTFTSQNGVTYDLNPTDGKRWLAVGPNKAAQTIVRAEIVNKRIGNTMPFLFITDDAVTDRFSGKTFVGNTTNAKGSKSPISIWTRIDWSSGSSANGGLRGNITNYKRNVVEAGQCKPAMTKKHTSMVKERFGQQGALNMVWAPGVVKGQDSLLVISTQTVAKYGRPAPTALQLADSLWKPGALNFTLLNSDKGLAKINVKDIRNSSAVRYC